MVWFKIFWNNTEADTKIGAICGSVTGTISYVLNMGWTAGFMFKIAEAGIVAFVAGFMGIVGKYVFEIVKPWIVKKISTPKK